MNILAVNPWIYDFAAYDFWLKPYGFIVLLTLLWQKGCSVRYIDCLDKKLTTDDYGRGKYASEIVLKPEILNSVPRRFKRYGLTIREFEQKLEGQDPDLILLTSSMTYWYPGLRQALDIISRRWPGIAVMIGGNYATLMPDHLRSIAPTAQLFSARQLNAFFAAIGIDADERIFYDTLPEYKLFYSRLDYAVLRSSWGCPFQCSYCAIKKLSHGFYRLPESLPCAFLEKYAAQGISDFVFYDDALLYPQEQARTLLKEIKKLRLKVRFHTPNAMHLRFIDREIASLLKENGFIKPHFGLETLDKGLQKQWGDKVSTKHLETAIDNLKKGGYKNGEFCVYLLLGYPNQDLASLKKDIDYLHSLGTRVSLAEFSPVPGTEFYTRFGQQLADPLLHNNSIFEFFEHKPEPFYEIKNYVRELNKSF